MTLAATTSAGSRTATDLVRIAAEQDGERVPARRTTDSAWADMSAVQAGVHATKIASALAAVGVERGGRIRIERTPSGPAVPLHVAHSPEPSST